MPSIRSLTLRYDALNEAGTFSEGDTVTGTVTLALLKETPVESLFVKAKGDAEVRWSQKSGDHTKNYSSSRRYFKHKVFLLAPQARENVLPQGNHVYNFMFTLPRESMPSSFRGSHGKIVYRLEAKLSRSWRLDTTSEKEIRFVSKAYPNLQSLMFRQVGSKTKETGVFSRGQIQLDAIVDKGVYAPGQTIAILAKVNNQTSSDVRPKFALLQEIVFRANGHSKHESDNILKVTENPVPPQSQRDVRCVLKLPNHLAFTISNCEIISVVYQLKVYVDVSFATDPKVLFPVVIIPLDLATGNQYPVHNPGGAAGGAAGGPSDSDFPPTAAFMSPPAPYAVNPSVRRYSPVPPAYSDSPPGYPGVAAAAYAPQPGIPGRSPVPSPYGNPYTSTSSTLHPPPAAPLPSAPPIQPPAFSPPPSAPAYSSLPSAPAMNMDFLSQSDEAPPSYSLLFPSSAPETSNGN